MRSVESVARKHTVLKPFPGKPGWFEGNCPLCDDDDGSFYIVADGSDEGFECYDCGVKGDALDLEYLLSGEGEIYAEPPNGNGKLPRVISASELLGLELPTVRWAIPDLLPEGVTILAGKPKLGKSWMALGFGITVSTGGVALGTKRVERGEALYLGLEDNHRRLQGRLRKLLVAGEAPEGLHIAVGWPRADEGGIEALDEYFSEHPACQLGDIDTLARFKPHTNGRRSQYDEDRDAVDPLVPLAAKHNVALLLVNHLRETESDDPLDMIHGSAGLTGGADGALVLKRRRGDADAYLHVDGRDIENPTELALSLTITPRPGPSWATPKSTACPRRAGPFCGFSKRQRGRSGRRTWPRYSI